MQKHDKHLNIRPGKKDRSYHIVSAVLIVDCRTRAIPNWWSPTGDTADRSQSFGQLRWSISLNKVKITKNHHSLSNENHLETVYIQRMFSWNNKGSPHWMPDCEARPSWDNHGNRVTHWFLKLKQNMIIRGNLQLNEKKGHINISLLQSCNL